MSWEDEISKNAQVWMKTMGNFGPTVRPERRELKGYTSDDDGDLVKTYYDSGELRELAAACIEVAEWLDKRAQQGNPNDH